MRAADLVAHLQSLHPDQDVHISDEGRLYLRTIPSTEALADAVHARDLELAAKIRRHRDVTRAAAEKSTHRFRRIIHSHANGLDDALRIIEGRHTRHLHLPEAAR